ncbi:hypothetical protein KR009_001589 [Drosophila setifemur]|nr:hypothetical protein KR009_001589 [Drosophila setifemur]
MTKDNKRKLSAQQDISSRMNFLFQAAHLMAESKETQLAAYYGRLCRNVGTKAMMHMAPALKRSLCRRCSLPLIPGINTDLQLVRDRDREARKEADQPKSEEAKPKKNRHRRLRRKPKERIPKPSDSRPEEIPLFLECPLCQSRRTFVANERRECWLEQREATVEVISVHEGETEREEGTAASQS